MIPGLIIIELIKLLYLCKNVQKLVHRLTRIIENDLVIEQAELNMKETAHLRIINKIKLATKYLSETYEN